LNQNPRHKYRSHSFSFLYQFKYLGIVLLGEAGAFERNMIRLSTRLVEGAVSANMVCSGKSDLLARLSVIAAENYFLDSHAVLEGMVERERLGPTGFGGGTAIPHCKVSGIDMPVAVFARLSKPVPYDAVDDEPVDLVCGLISPAQDGASHLRALAEVSRLFRDEKFRAQLRGAADSAAMFAVLTLSEERDAA
jgi:PTS system nitrogen regulatory IIA component